MIYFLSFTVSLAERYNFLTAWMFILHFITFHVFSYFALKDAFCYRSHLLNSPLLLLYIHRFKEFVLTSGVLPQRWQCWQWDCCRAEREIVHLWRTGGLRSLQKKPLSVTDSIMHVLQCSLYLQSVLPSSCNSLQRVQQMTSINNKL